jgi:hypothetical protein
MDQIRVQMDAYLDSHGHGEFHRFTSAYNKAEFRRMFKMWSLDSLRYIDHVLAVCDVVDLLKRILEDEWELSEQRKAALSRIYANIDEIRRLDLETKNTILRDAPWEQFGMTRLDEDEVKICDETIAPSI